MKNAILLTTLTLLISCSSNESIKYQFRGEDRNGIYHESELLKEWPLEGPEEILSIENIGNGYGSPIVTEDKIYISGEIDSMAILFCLNHSGDILWQTEFGVEWSVNFPGSRSSPTLVDNMIYIGSGMGNLHCINANTGEKIWWKDLIEDFDGVLPRFGHSEAALVYDDKVFWIPGGEKYNVVALNRFTGELIWSNPGFSERSAYNSPKLIELETRNILAAFSAYHLMGIDTETGELLWSHEQDNTPLEERTLGQGDTHGNTVLYENGSIYYAVGDGNCGVKLELSEDGSEIREVWRNKGFDSFMGGIVKFGNYLYAGATLKKELRSIDATTGVITDSLKIGSGALIAADNMLYYYNQKGELILLAFAEGKMKEISSFKIKKGSKEHFSHPVIHNGILYQRHGNALMAFDIKMKSEEE
ncbi:MAG: PQQ-like beta-propeller repeat protein [Bacteroidales bacterium]|nr:PQQ-like beta-propeller repeat protein [Bacteroidales bacterium]